MRREARVRFQIRFTGKQCDACFKQINSATNSPSRRLDIVWALRLHLFAECGCRGQTDAAQGDSSRACGH